MKRVKYWSINKWRDKLGMSRQMMSAFWSGGQHARRRQPRHRHLSQSINQSINQSIAKTKNIHVEEKSLTLSKYFSGKDGSPRPLP